MGEVFQNPDVIEEQESPSALPNPSPEALRPPISEKTQETVLYRSKIDEYINKHFDELVQAPEDRDKVSEDLFDTQVFFAEKHKQFKIWEVPVSGVKGLIEKVRGKQKIVERKEAEIQREETEAQGNTRKTKETKEVESEITKVDLEEKKFSNYKDYYEKSKAEGKTNLEIIDHILANPDEFELPGPIMNRLQNFQRLQAISENFSNRDDQRVVAETINRSKVMSEGAFTHVLDAAYQNVSDASKSLLAQEYPQLRHEGIDIQITPANADTVGDVRQSHEKRNDEIEEVKQYATKVSEKIDTVDTEIEDLETGITQLENKELLGGQLSPEEAKKLEEDRETLKQKEEEKEKLEKQKEEAEAILAEVKTEKDDSGSSVLYLRDGLDTTIDEDGDITVHLSDRDIPIHIEDNRPGGYATENEQINAVVFWDAMQNGRGGQMQLSFDLFGDLTPGQAPLREQTGMIINFMNNIEPGMAKGGIIDQEEIKQSTLFVEQAFKKPGESVEAVRARLVEWKVLNDGTAGARGRINPERLNQVVRIARANTIESPDQIGPLLKEHAPAEEQPHEDELAARRALNEGRDEERPREQGEKRKQRAKMRRNQKGNL